MGLHSSLFVWRKVCFPRIKKTCMPGNTLIITRWQAAWQTSRGAGTDLTALSIPQHVQKSKKTYRAIKAASIAVSAGLGAGREIVTLCVRGALLTTRPGVCHGVAEGAPMERDTGRNTVKSVQGQIRLAHWNRWSFIGCVIMSRILGNWMQHVHTCTCAYNHTQGTFRAKVARRFCAGYQKEPRLPHAWVTCNVRMHHTCS